MKIKDFFRMKFFSFKNRNEVIIGKETIIKRSLLEGKNIFGSKNEILNSKIGFGTYFGSDNKIDGLEIGKYCSIASEMKIITGNHPLNNNVSTHPAFFLNKYSKFRKLKLSYVKSDKYSDNKMINNKWNAVIGNDVWIGSDVKILQGVIIGDGAVIGAGALVTKNIKPYSIVGGVPAKLIRKRFSDEDISFLLELKWWNKGEKWIKENAEYFEDVEVLKREI